MVVDTYAFDETDQPAIRIEFINYNKNGKKRKYTILVDWSQDSLLNLHVDGVGINDKEYFFKEIKLK
tara:strand:- start:507 stop:707 length:201 start_codon:yes stop_codon:yes gene_type:complete